MQPVPAYLFLTFLKIGATSWGGFMSLISMIQKKVVEKDRMLDNAKVMEGISLASVLPGPMAVNVVSYVGYQLGGWKGALISVTAVILPSFVLMLALSHFYFQYGDVPAMSHFFAGILPAVAAIIISVAISMGRKSISDIPQVLIAVVSAVAVFVSKSYFSTMAILLASALMGYLIYFKKTASTAAPESARPGFKIPYPLVMAAILLIGLITWPQSNPFAALHRTILLTFSGMSLTQFGGGYVIIPAMQKIIVDGHRWLSDRAFADAIAMGQVTPGPIFISATFIGYKLAGFWGALNATIAIFTPTAILTIIAARFFNKISQSELVVAVFKGLRPAIIGMIVSAGVSILWGNGFTLFSVAVFSATLGATIYFKTDPAIVVPVAGILGLLIL
ncbi:chromate efflux transporter [Dyadobacter jiangsuensis]|uniref:Chromate transporter n=1 Tax=Dyadobacter jiangsuensis TaxID=1591085 RepID=A0A2P8GIQ6_9BACT|nr:chromate efflux transporter [Dyadobacter jiangsuensis]PSL33859.1 chromate transporter [Dyadobacter jiangsuensis]